MKKSWMMFLLVLFLLAGCKGVKNPVESESSRFDVYTDVLAKKIIEESPLNATFMYGDLESIGLDHLLYELDDLSDEAIKKHIADAKRVLEDLKGFNKKELTRDQQWTYDMIVYQNEAVIEGEEYLKYYNAFQPSSGIHINIPLSFMQIELESEKEVKAYLERCKLLKRLIDQYVDLEKERASISLLLPADQYEIVIGQIEELMVDPESFMMYLSFADRIDQLDEISQKEKKEYKAEFLTIVKEEIYPAFEKMKSELETIKLQSKNSRGLSQWEKGSQYYDFLVRTGTSYDMDAEALRGWAEAQMTASSIRLQNYFAKHPEFAAQGDLSSLLPEVSSREEMIELEENFMEKAFLDYDVHRASENIIPEYLQDHMPPAFYFPISIDGEDYGNMYMTQEAYEQVGVETLETDIHENVPGHHLYFSVLYRSDLPLIRKVYDFPAYVEGWAQYVQGKIYEYSSKDQETADLWASLLSFNYAYQILLDIQVNYDGISREEAINQLVLMGYDQDTAETAYNRMIANPGEMINYYYGAYVINGYLKQCMEEQKDKFNVKEFHDLILMHGGLPFKIMDELVEDYLN